MMIKRKSKSVGPTIKHNSLLSSKKSSPFLFEHHPAQRFEFEQTTHPPCLKKGAFVDMPTAVKALPLSSVIPLCHPSCVVKVDLHELPAFNDVHSKPCHHHRHY